MPSRTRRLPPVVLRTLRRNMTRLLWDREWASRRRGGPGSVGLRERCRLRNEYLSKMRTLRAGRGNLSHDRDGNGVRVALQSTQAAVAQVFGEDGQLGLALEAGLGLKAQAVEGG